MAETSAILDLLLLFKRVSAVKAKLPLILSQKHLISYAADLLINIYTIKMKYSGLSKDAAVWLSMFRLFALLLRLLYILEFENMETLSYDIPYSLHFLEMLLILLILRPQVFYIKARYSQITWILCLCLWTKSSHCRHIRRNTGIF